jgi:hypothetical protein
MLNPIWNTPECANKFGWAASELLAKGEGRYVVCSVRKENWRVAYDCT